MRQVCYLVDLGIVTAQDTKIHQLVFFGNSDQVYKDLETEESGLQQSILIHVQDVEFVAIAKAKLQIIHQLMRHDLNELPKYPAIGQGSAQLQDGEANIVFRVHIRVSIRGEVDSDDVTKPVNILLPPGVRV